MPGCDEDGEHGSPARFDRSLALLGMTVSWWVARLLIDPPGRIILTGG
jgi:hypothetical protein